MKSLQEAAKELFGALRPTEFFSVSEMVHRIKDGPTEGTHEFHVHITPDSKVPCWYLISHFDPDLDVALAKALAEYQVKKI